jgi:hypothetical protein
VLALLSWMHLVMSTSAFVHADGGVQVELHWEGGTACADDERARRRLARELARIETRADERVVANVTLTAAGDRLEATLQLRTTAGESQRSMHAAHCEEIEGAVALLIATTLDPFVDLRSPSPSMVSLVVPESRPETRLSSRTQPDEQVEATQPSEDELEIVAVDEPMQPRPSISLVASVGAGITGGLLPAAGPHVELLVGGQWDWLRIAALGSHAFSRRSPIADVPEASMVLQAWGVGGIGCGVPATARLEIPLCVGVEGGRMLGAGRGEGLEFTTSASRPWLGVVARAGLHMAVTPRLRLSLDVHGDAIAWRPAFHVEGVGRVHLASRVGGRAVLGIGLRLP